MKNQSYITHQVKIGAAEFTAMKLGGSHEQYQPGVQARYELYNGLRRVGSLVSYAGNFVHFFGVSDLKKNIYTAKQVVVTEILK